MLNYLVQLGPERVGEIVAVTGIAYKILDKMPDEGWERCSLWMRRVLIIMCLVALLSFLPLVFLC